MKTRLLRAALITGMLYSSVGHAQTTLYGITNANQMFSIGSVGSPSSVTGPYSISGAASGQEMIALASRPSTGGLYGLGYDSTTLTAQLYLITGSGSAWTATAVGGTSSLNLGLSNNAAFDFVSTNDNQIRVIGRNGNNYMMSAANGSIMTTGTGTLSYAAGDIYAGTSSTLAATAYTNHFYGSDATDEVGYDAVNNVLVTMDAGGYANGFNNASDNMHSIGTTTGLVLSAAGSVGMDTWYDTISHTNFIFMTSTPLLSTGAHLYEYAMNGSSGTTMTDLGAIGSGSLNVRDIAFLSASRDSTAAITGKVVAGLSLNQRNIVYFDSYNPRNIRQMVTLNGMTSGQTMVGIDYSSNGTLYGLGYNSGSKTYQLYTIDSATGTVFAVNSTAGSLNLGTDDGSGNYVNAGFRFVPTATNRIRVMGDNGNTNSQIDATTGDIVETDTVLQYISGDGSFGTTPNITSMAYTGYNGDGSTQLFGYDANSGSMVTFDEGDNASGLGTGSSGYINTNLALSTTLSLDGHTSGYNNAHMNIMYDQSSSANLGYIASNYYGDSSTDQGNYSVLYNMTDMLTAYGRTTATAAPAQAGGIGYGVPVKDIAVRRPYTPESVPTIANNTTNDLLVYPNPATSYTRIVLPNASTGTVYVDVIDLSGLVDCSFHRELTKQMWIWVTCLWDYTI